jgi:Domain of unknown function (DUF4167)
MRPIPHQKRPRGRGNGRRPHLPLRAQTFDSNGPNIRVRGNAYQVLEKYLALARDAAAVGDRVAAENYFQHAEHYYRMINQTPQNDPNRNGGQNTPRMAPADFTADGVPSNVDSEGNADEDGEAETSTNGHDSGDGSPSGSRDPRSEPSGE